LTIGFFHPMKKGKVMKKRILSAVVVLVLFAGVLAGCISGNGTQDAKLNIIDDNYRNYYEIFVGSFYDSDGDGMGDLKGVEEKLDYISDLGCNGIWLMPIMPSPTYHKYDTTDYEAVDEAYGTADDFKELASACHKKGIRLIIDVAMNHSSSQHPWFTQACEYLAGLKAGEKPDDTVCPYVDYYHFSDKQEGTTYYAVPGSSSWWYEGSFWSEMPDLNLKSPAVQKEFEEVADYWIDLGVDGFRMDAAMHYEENATNANCDILNKLYTYCKEKNPQFYMVSEVWASENIIADYYASGTPSMFNFDAGTAKGALVNAVRKGDPVSLVNSMLKYQNDFSAKNPDYIDAPFLSNHDMARIANTLVNDPDKIKTAAGLLMTMNGSPFVYYGEEIGMNSSGTKDENKRIPMVWSKTDTTGMTKGPADMDAGIESPFPAEDEQEKDKDSILSYYKNALRLRNQNPEIARGTIEKVESLCKDSQAAITKTYQDSTIGIVYNLGEGNGTVDLKKTALENMNLEGSLTLKEETVQLKDGKLEMPACSIAVLK
jgi:alpha amylase catalytic region